ncbi:hypothetical protein ABZ946_23615 [Streptomyces sp. NPDC046324]|uniref:hypothetical protein n=1 Tax=Streptomyces sp. NPDC046324 TaxID=3154915 RepID=UPI0033E9579E
MAESICRRASSVRNRAGHKTPAFPHERGRELGVDRLSLAGLDGVGPCDFAPYATGPRSPSTGPDDRGPVPKRKDFVGEVRDGQGVLVVAKDVKDLKDVYGSIRSSTA